VLLEVFTRAGIGTEVVQRKARIADLNRDRGARESRRGKA
jgi:hypothetical protein